MEQAQDALCPAYRVVEPDHPGAAAIYEQLYPLYTKLYFGLGNRDATALSAGGILPALRLIAQIH